MIVKSFLAMPKSDQLENLVESMRTFKGCEVIPPSNSKDLVVLVIESPDQKTEDALLFQLQNIPSLDHMILVSSFVEPTVNN